MAEPPRGRTPERYEDTIDPKNPPNSVTRPQVRSAAVWWYLGSVIALFVLVGIALIYWLAANPRPSLTQDPQIDRAVGTSGDTTPGGHDPMPRFRNTEDELKFRGTGK
jgi:hypothetical protein